MRGRIRTEEFHLFRDFLHAHSGIWLGDDKKYLVENRLGGLLNAAGVEDFRALYDAAVRGADAGLADLIVDRMTTNETSWFRDRYPYQGFRDIFLSKWRQEIETGRRRSVRIWSAACSTGQEPYSLAMLAFEAAERSRLMQPETFEITATDLSRTVLREAAAGSFSQSAMMRGMSDRLRRKFFRPDGRRWRIDPRLRAMIRFKRFNLQGDLSPLGEFDLVFLRNVMIYFNDELRSRILDGAARRLLPGGALFLGASESAILYTKAFRMAEPAPGVICYVPVR